MLAVLARNQQASSYITLLSDSKGSPFTHTVNSMNIFCTFYVDLYFTKVQPTSLEINEFLDNCELPCLSTSDREQINAPLTLEELSSALAYSHNSKSPGADSLPSEVYKRYADLLFLDLPDSMDTCPIQHIGQTGNLEGVSTMGSPAKGIIVW